MLLRLHPPFDRFAPLVPSNANHSSVSTGVRIGNETFDVFSIRTWAIGRSLHAVQSNWTQVRSTVHLRRCCSPHGRCRLLLVVLLTVAMTTKGLLEEIAKLC